MDIDLLSRIVKELITDHDKVGLPGLGTFVAEVVPASFSDKGYTINPPYRRLSFHPDNTEADLLVKFYSDSNHVPLEASRVYITEFLSELKQVLIQRKTVIFPGLGRLRATKENNFFFVPDEDLDIYPDGFGLQPVSMKYIQGVADPVDIKLSYSDAMRGFEDRHRAAEPELPAEMGQLSEPVQPVAEGQPAEPGQSSEPVLPITEARHQPEAEGHVQREERPGIEPVQSVEPDHTEPVQPVAEGQPVEPVLPVTEGQSSEPDHTEPVLPITEARHQPEAEGHIQREEQPGTEPVQPSEPGQSSESELTTEPVQPSESGQLSEPVQPVAEGQPSEPVQPTELDHTEPVQPSEDPSERQCGAAPAEQLHGAESDTALVELPGGERDAAPAEQLHGGERGAAPAEQLQGEERDAAPAELPGEETGVVRRRCRWWIAPVVVLSLAVVALGVFVILAHAAPDFIDSILYTPEELKILNY